MKCDNCAQTATVHSTQIMKGMKAERHLCKKCAAAIGGFPANDHVPTQELLRRLVEKQMKDNPPQPPK